MTLKAIVPVGLVAAFAILLLLLQGARTGRDAARREQAAAEAAAAVAAGQSDITGATTMAAQAAQARQLTVTIQAKEAADDIAEVPGADTPVPDAVLDRWGGAVDRLRDEAAAARAAADPAGGGEPARAVPAPRASGGAERG